MRCPYCAESIQDEAIFCRHCRHDLALVRGLQSSSRPPKVATGTAGRGITTDHSDATPPIFGAALVVLATVGFFYVRFPAPLAERVIWLAIAFPPAALGILLGFAWRGLRWPAFIVSGIGMGLLNLTTIWMLLASPDSEWNGYWAVALFAVAQPALFAGGGLIGVALSAVGRRAPLPSSELWKVVMQGLLGVLLQVLGHILVRAADQELFG